MIINGKEMLRTGYCGKREEKPRVALLDNFENAATSTAHGEMTESVLMNSAGLGREDVQRYHCGNGNPIPVQQVLQAPADKLGGALRAHIGLSGALFLRATTEDLKQVLSEQPSVKVISQSESQSPVRAARPFYEAAAQDPAFRERLGAALGVAPNAGLPAVAGELFAQAENFLRDPEAVKQARKDYLEVTRQLSEKGVTYLVAAGNLGEFVSDLERKGVTFSPSASRSLLVGDNTTVVGSLDENGGLASFNSPRSGIDVLTPGVNIPFSDPTPGPGKTPNEVLYGNGTSLSVPLAAGRAVKMLEANPTWGPFEIKSELQGVKSSRYTIGQEGPVLLSDGSTQTMRADGNVDDFILDKIGTGFISGLGDDSVPQFVNSDKAFRLVLPGETPDVSQVIDCRDNGSGQRKFTLETYFGTQRHVIRGEYANGAWNPERTVEEFYCNPPAA